MKTKICTCCKKRKNIEQFYKGNDRYGLGYKCKKCLKEYAKKSMKRIINYRKMYNIKNRNKIRKHDRFYSLTPNGIYSHLKAGAKENKKLFNISKEDFISWYNFQEQECHYCKRTIKDTNKDSNKKYNRLSIDRIDNNKGYILNNIVLSCTRCNLIKSNIFTYNQMFKIIEILKEKE